MVGEQAEAFEQMRVESIPSQEDATMLLEIRKRDNYPDTGGYSTFLSVSDTSLFSLNWVIILRSLVD